MKSEGARFIDELVKEGMRNYSDLQPSNPKICKEIKVKLEVTMNTANIDF